MDLIHICHSWECEEPQVRELPRMLYNSHRSHLVTQFLEESSLEWSRTMAEIVGLVQPALCVIVEQNFWMGLTNYRNQWYHLLTAFLILNNGRRRLSAYRYLLLEGKGKACILSISLQTIFYFKYYLFWVEIKLSFTSKTLFYLSKLLKWMS